MFLTYPPSAFIDRLNAPVTSERPLYDFESSDRVRHRVWRVTDPVAYADGFRRVFKAYVADGHHRSASAWRAARERRAANPRHTGLEEYNWFPAVLFPSNQVHILPYNRVVRDLRGQTAEQVLERLGTVGHLSPAASPTPPQRGSFGVHLAGRWYLLELPGDSIVVRDPVLSLDAALLEERVLGPILGVEDVRTDPRIGFVGGIRGSVELERQVASGEAAIAFALFPVTVDDLVAVADAGGIMPPKTTWFEPKLKSGLFVHTLD